MSPTIGGIQPCTGTDLAAEVTAGDGAAGSSFFVLALENTAATSCTVSGTPGIQLVDGQDVVFLDSADLGAPASTTPLEPVFPLAGSRASTIYLVVRFANYCGDTPVPPVRLALVLPSSLGRLVATYVSGTGIAMASCVGETGAVSFEVYWPWSPTVP